MRPLARWGSLPLLAMPIGSWALGLGEIELHSALNQPLDADIELVSATAEELKSLDISMAPLASFQRYGLEKPSFLNSIVFELGRNGAGQNIIRVRSTQPIAEPFVTMLVEAEWGRGRLLREYTVFLDPPVLLPAPVDAGPVAPPQTRPTQPSSASGPISRATPAPAPAPVPAPAPARSPAAEAPAPGRAAPTSGPAAVADGTTFGPVQRGGTLWGIATNYRPNGISVNQAMVAIYRANPDAFSGNMNRLRRGAILRIPPAADMRALPVSEATAEVIRQDAAWRGGSTPAPDPRLVLVPPTEVPAVSDGAGGRVALNADTGEVTALRDQVRDLEQQLQDRDRLLELRNQELANLQNELAEEPADASAADVAAPVAAADPGRELESEQLFVDESPEPVADTGAEAAADTALDDATANATDIPESNLESAVDNTPAPTALPPARTQPPAPSLVDRALGLLTSTTALIGGGILLLLLGAVMFLRRRRAEVEDATGQWEALEAELDEDDEEVAATARLRARSSQANEDILVEEAVQPAAAEPDDETGTFSGVFEEPRVGGTPAAEETMSSQTLSSQTVINLDQADPIAEADFHMAYGLYDQAADLVTKALEADPDNLSYRLKLLEIFFVWGNKDSFLEAARTLKQEHGDADGEWAKVVIMGKQICPDDALFADAQAGAGSIDLDLEAGDAPGLDLAFGADDGQSVDLSFDEETGHGDQPALAAGAGETIDLDIGGDSGADFADLVDTGFSLEDTQGSQAADDDDALDLGEQTQAGLEAALFETDEAGERTSPGAIIDELDESLSATQESPTIETPAGEFDLGDDDDFEVTLESPTVESAAPDLDESPTIETVVADAETMESPAFGSDSPTVETPTIETEGPDSLRANRTQEMTAELDLGDLGLDISDIDNLDADLGDLPHADDAESDTRRQPSLEADDSLLSATGVTQVLTQEDIEANDLVELTNTKIEALDTQVLPESEETMLAPAFDDRPAHVDTEIISRPEVEDETVMADSLNLDLEDFSEALQGGDTVEQPLAGEFDESLFGDDDGTPIDLDVGSASLSDDEPTGTEAMAPLDAQTMTEVGTKLDLARAYIDMGDPEGAKSILEEVLSEGDSGQRKEAQSLIDVLPA